MVFYSRGIVKVSAAPVKATTSEGTEKMREDDDSSEASYLSEEGEDEDDVLDSDDDSSAPPDDYDKPVVVDSKDLGPVAPESPTESGQFDSFDLLLPGGELVSPLTLHESVTGSHLVFDNAAPRFPASNRRQNARNDKTRTNDKPQAARRRLKHDAVAATSRKMIRDPMSRSDHGSSSNRRLNSRDGLGSSDHRPQQPKRTSSNNAKNRRGGSRRDGLSQSDHRVRSRTGSSNSNDMGVLSKMDEVFGGPDLAADRPPTSTRRLDTSEGQKKGELAQSHHSTSSSRGSSQQKQGRSQEKPRSQRGGFGERSHSGNSRPKSSRKLGSLDDSKHEEEDPKRHFRRSGSEDNILSPRRSKKDTVRSSSLSPNSRRRRLRKDTDQSNKDAERSPRRRTRKGSSDSDGDSRGNRRQSSLSPASRRKRLLQQEGREHNKEAGRKDIVEDSDTPQVEPSSPQTSKDGSKDGSKGSRRRTKGDSEESSSKAKDSSESPVASRRRFNTTEGYRRPSSQSPTARRRTARDELRKQFSGGVESTSSGGRRRRRLKRDNSQEEETDPQSSERDLDTATESEDAETASVDDDETGHTETEEPNNQPQHQERHGDEDGFESVEDDDDKSSEEAKPKSSRRGFARSLLNKTASLSSLASKAISMKKNPKSSAMNTMESVEEWSSGSESGDKVGPLGETAATEVAASSNIDDTAKDTESTNQTADPKAKQSKRRMVIEKAASLSNIGSRALIYAAAKKTEKKSLLGDFAEADEDPDGDAASSLTAAKKKNSNTGAFLDASFSDLALDFAVGEARNKAFTVGLDSVNENGEESIPATEDDAFAVEGTGASPWEASFEGEGGNAKELAGLEDPDSSKRGLRRSKSSEGPSLISARPRPGMARAASSARSIVKNSTSITSLFRYASAKKFEKKSLLLDHSEEGEGAPDAFDDKASDDGNLPSVAESDDEKERKQEGNETTDDSEISKEAITQSVNSGSTKPASSKWALLRKKTVSSTAAEGESKDSTANATGADAKGSSSKSKWARLKLGTDFIKEGRKRSQSRRERRKQREEHKVEEEATVSITSEKAGGSLDIGSTKPQEKTTSGDSKPSSKWSKLKQGLAAAKEKEGKSAGDADESGDTKSKWSKLKLGGAFVKEGQRRARSRREERRKRKEERVKTDEKDESNAADDKVNRAMDLVASIKRDNSVSSIGDALIEDLDPEKETTRAEATANSKWNDLKLVAAATKERAEGDAAGTEKLKSTAATSKWNKLRQGIPDSAEKNQETKDKAPTPGASNWDKLKQASTTSDRRSSSDKWRALKHSEGFILNTRSRARESRRRRHRDRDGERSSEVTRDSESRGIRSSRRENKHAESEDGGGSKSSEKPRSKWEELKAKAEAQADATQGDAPTTHGEAAEESRVTTSRSSKWEGLKGKLDASKAGSSSSTRGTSSRTLSSKKWDALKGGTDFITETRRRARASERRRRRRDGENASEPSEGRVASSEADQQSSSEDRRRRRQRDLEKDAHDATSATRKAGTSGVTNASGGASSKWTELDITRLAAKTSIGDESAEPSTVTASTVPQSKWAIVSMLGEIESSQDEKSTLESVAAVKQEQPQSKWAELKSGKLDLSKLAAEEVDGTVPNSKPRSAKWTALKGGMAFINKSKEKAEDSRKERRLRRRERKSDEP